MIDRLSANINYLARKHGIPETLNKKTGEMGVAQEALEDLTGVAQTTISGILRQGKTPRLSTLEQIAKGFGVEVWQLFAPKYVLIASLDSNATTLVEHYYACAPQHQAAIVDMAKMYASQADQSGA